MNHSGEHNAFTNIVDRVLSVSREEILRREAAYKAQSEAKPSKRGPKRKVVNSPSVPGPGEEPPS